MPNFVAKPKDGPVAFVELCDPCAALILKYGEEGEVTLCDVCAARAIAAKIPLKKPHGKCAWCQKEKELTQEYMDHPDIKMCEDCAPDGKLKPRQDVCSGCFQMKRGVFPAYMLAGRLFGLCKACDNRYRPKE